MTIAPPPPPKWGSYFLATLIFTVFIFITDILLFVFIAPDYFMLPGMKDQPEMGSMAIGYILGGLLFCYAYVHLVRDKVAVTGWYFGMVVALLVFLPAAFIYNSLMEKYSLVVALVECLFHVIQFGIAGRLVGPILKRQ